MVSLHAVVCALMVVGAGDTVLLDFSAEWCGPCRQMGPVVRQLTAAGYPVRQVNIDHDRALAAKYGVTGVPCFVMIVNGREVDRVVGATSAERLMQMLSAARPAQQTIAPPAAPAQAKLTAVVKPRAKPLIKVGASNRQELERRLLAASVRLRIDDGRGNSVGSGTIIDSRAGEALIVTCGHVFRDSQGKGKIVVDLFGDQPATGIPAQLVDYDLDRDIGLISIRPSVPVTVAPLALADYKPQPNEPVIDVGCDHGADPTLQRTRIMTIDKFLGPSNLQVDGQPVQGRSGGGLFTVDGRVIGVCNAADPADNQGLFAALSSIYAMLAKTGLDETLASNDKSPPTMPAQMPGATASAAPAATVASTELSSSEIDALAQLGGVAEGAEVICIVRSLADPRAKSEVIVLDRASPKFLEQLAAARSQQGQRQLTSLRTNAR